MASTPYVILEDGYYVIRHLECSNVLDSMSRDCAVRAGLRDLTLYKHLI